MNDKGDMLIWEGDKEWNVIDKDIFERKDIGSELKMPKKDIEASFYVLILWFYFMMEFDIEMLLPDS